MTRSEAIDAIRRIRAEFLGTDLEGRLLPGISEVQELRARLTADPEPQEESQIIFEDGASLHLFVTLARQHGFSPYRRPRQRRTTVMLRIGPATSTRLRWKSWSKVSCVAPRRARPEGARMRRWPGRSGVRSAYPLM